MSRKLGVCQEFATGTGALNMAQVRITGWRPGLQQVSVIHAIKIHSHLSLVEAKICTNALLSGEIVVVETPTMRDADELANKLFSFGANAYAIDDQSPPLPVC